MKAPVLLLFGFLFSLEAAAQMTSCFDHFFKEGEAALLRRRPNFELARKKFAAAKECEEATYEQKRTMERRIREVEERNLNALENEIDRAESARDEANRQSVEADSLRKIAVFALDNSEKERKKADSLRVEAQKSARRALANDLAFKAQTALRDGDRTTAFRLAEMSWQFVDPGNQRTEQALVEIFFQNEKAKNARPLSWKTAAFSLFTPDELPTMLEISSDGKAVATATTGEGAVMVWEIASGRELFSAYETGQIGAIAIADEGRFFIFSDEKNLRIWQKNGSAQSRVLYNLGANEYIVSITITSDQTRVIARFDDHSVLVFDLETGAERARLGFEKGEFAAWSQVSADGKKLFLHSKNGHFQSFDLEKGEKLSQFEPNENSSKAPLLAFAQTFDGSRAAVSQPDRTLRIFDLQAGKMTLEFRPETLAAYRLTFSPDGRFLTAFYTNNTTQKWDAATGELVENRTEEQGIDPSIEYGSLTFSPDGRWVLRHSNFETAELFEAENFGPDQKPTRVFRFGQLIREARFSPDSRAVLVILETGAAQLFDLENPKSILSFGSGNAINFVDFAQKCPVLAFVRDGGGIEIWATETQSSLFPSLEKDENGGTLLNDFSIAPDGKTMALMFLGDSIQLRSSADGRLLFTKKNEGTYVHFSPDSRLAATYSLGQPTLRIFEIPSGKLLKKADLDFRTGIFSILFSPDGHWLEAYDLGDSTKTALFDLQNLEQKKLPNGADFVFFSSKSSRSVLISENWSAIEPFDLEKMQPSGERLFFDPRSITNLRFSPSGEQFFFIENSQTLLVFDFPSGKKKWEANFEGLRNLSWSADGLRILTADYYLIAWEAATGKMLFDLPFNSYKSDVSSDGRLLLTVSGQREALIFDAATGQKLVALRGHGTINNMRFSPDSRRVVTACTEGFAEIWDAQTGRQLFLLQGDTTVIDRAEFFENGSKLAIAQGFQVKIWVLETDKILEKTNASSPIAPLSADQIFDFLAGEAVFENADWATIRNQISPIQAIELARHFARQGELSRSSAAYDKNFGLAEQFFRSALNDLGSPSVLLELAAVEAQWMQRALASGRRDETLKRAKQVEKLLASAPSMPSISKLDLAQALSVMSRKGEAKALFSKVSTHDTAQMKNVLYQMEQNSRNLSNLDANEYGEFDFEKDAPNVIVENNLTENEPPVLLSAFDQFAEGNIEKAIELGGEELTAALKNNLDYAWGNSAVEVAYAFGNLSFYFLFEKRFAESRQLAEFGLAVDSSQQFLRTNLAHAHLFLDETKRAMAIYSALKNTPDPSFDGQTFGQTMIADLEKLAEKGIRPKDLEKVLQLLGKKK